MTWFEQLENLLTQARLTGRKIESRSPRSDESNGGWTAWKEIGDDWPFHRADQFRLAAMTKVRPFTLAELTEHFNKPIVRFPAHAESGPHYTISSLGAGSVTVTCQSTGKFLTLMPSDLATHWHFLRDGQGDKSWPPVGVVETIPAGDAIPELFDVDQEAQQEAKAMQQARDYADSVGACLRAVGLDPVKDEETIRSYGSKPSDAVRFKYLEFRDPMTAAPDLRIPNQPEPVNPKVVHFNIHDVAKDAAERASKNAGSSDRCVPPELLFAPITYALWDAFGVNGWDQPVGPVQVINQT